MHLHERQPLEDHEVSYSDTSSNISKHAAKQDDINAIVSAPSFSLVTSLMYHYFNENDLRDEDGDEDDSGAETHALIKKWREIDSKLLQLHVQRLRGSAEALRREHDFPCDATGQQDLQKCTAYDDLEALINEKATSYATSSDLAPPVRGTMRSHKVRILICQQNDVCVEVGVSSVTNEVAQLSSSIRSFTTCPFTLDVETPASLVTLDTAESRPSLFTRHKTTHRSPYDESRSRAIPKVSSTTLPTKREVLLFNDRDEIMEASLSSVYFHRDGRWVTPSADCGGMQSVTKMYALEKGWCVEGVVRRESFSNGEVVWLGNAVRGFFPGKLLGS